MDNLTETFENASLNDGPEGLEQLPFRPQADSGMAETALDDNIPRYLFRVVSPKSDGYTDEKWVRSMSAHRNRSSSASIEDIFSNLDSKKRTHIAQALVLHLRWWPKDGVEDNFVSWTSSLLFAIQYIYYRHVSPRDGSSLQEIKLYIIDTTQFPRGTFLRDLDLIDAFYEPNDDLKRLRNIRNGLEYYYGEYLSQGSLKIENKCQMIPANILFEQNRLRRIQPEFAEFSRIRRDTTASIRGNPPWPKEVNRLRNTIWPGTNLPILSTAEILPRLRAIEEITQNVASAWRLPIAIYFAALIGSESSGEEQEKADDNVFFASFRSTSSASASSRNSHGTDCISNSSVDLQEEFRPSNLNVVAPDTMPELKQVQKIVREIYKHSQLRRALDQVKEAEINIRNLHIRNILSENGRHDFSADDPNPVLARAGHNILSKLDAVEMLCEGVRLALSSERA